MTECFSQQDIYWQRMPANTWWLYKSPYIHLHYKQLVGRWQRCSESCKDSNVPGWQGFVVVSHCPSFCFYCTQVSSLIFFFSLSIMESASMVTVMLFFFLCWRTLADTCIWQIIPARLLNTLSMANLLLQSLQAGRELLLPQAIRFTYSALQERSRFVFLSLPRLRLTLRIFLWISH